MSSEEGVSASYDEARHGSVPALFLQGCKGDVQEAQRRWAATSEWRNRESIDGILEEPQHHFGLFKTLYPHFLHGQAKNGNFVYFERPGLADFTPLQEGRVTVDDIVRHYVFVMEYIYGVLDTRSNAKIITVWDCTGANPRNLVGDQLKLLKATMSVVSAHYPERSDKLFIINAPFWFTGIWRMISPWIDPNTRKKFSILGTGYAKELCEYMGAENVPSHFGGQDPTPIGNSPQERELYEYVHAHLSTPPQGDSPDGTSGGSSSSSSSSSSSNSRSSSSSSSNGAADPISSSQGGATAVPWLEEDEDDDAVEREEAAAGASPHASGSAEDTVSSVIDVMNEMEVVVSQIEEARRVKAEVDRQFRRAKLVVDELVGRRRGLSMQMLNMITYEEVTADGEISLTLTMQLNRIRREALELCYDERDKRALLEEEKAKVNAAKLAIDDLMQRKRRMRRSIIRVVKRLSSLEDADGAGEEAGARAGQRKQKDMDDEGASAGNDGEGRRHIAQEERAP